MIAFVIYGQPHAQERSGNQIRPNKSGKLTVHHFDQPKSAAFKQEVKLMAVAAMNKARIFEPIKGPVVLTVRAFRSIPTSWSNKKKAAAAAGQILPITKPDLKNYIWGIEDALNAIAWRDDGQVVTFGRSGKFYTDGRPRVEVTIEPYVPTDVVVHD